MKLTVLGTPAPQGSKRGFVNRRTGRVNLVESSAKVTPWREAVVAAAYAERSSVDSDPIDGPVSVAIYFYLARPVSAPKRRRWPDRKPDIDKLVRSTLDGLTTAGVFTDDARVVTLNATKVYVGGHTTGGPDVPGATIWIEELQ